MSNVSASPLQNVLAGGILGNVGVATQHAQLAMSQVDVLRQYNAAVSGTPFPYATRLQLEVDVLSNGFVLSMGRERLIAKDIEELQQHFVSQVANLLLEKGS